MKRIKTTRIYNIVPLGFIKVKRQSGHHIFQYIEKNIKLKTKKLKGL